MQGKQESVYPLDKNRQLLSETVDDDDKTVRRRFRLFAPDGDSIEIEVEQRLPWFISRPVPHDRNFKIISEEVDMEGTLHKIVMCEEDGELKEYYVQEKLPKDLGKRKASSTDLRENAKRMKLAQDQSDKNLKEMLLQQQLNKKKLKGSDELLLKLSKTSAAEWKPAREQIITVERRDSLLSAFKKMKEFQISSVPVLNQDSCYFGFLDMIDLVSWVVNEIGEHALNKKDLSIEAVDHFKEAKVKDVMTYPVSKKSPFHPFGENASLISVFESLAQGTHRVPIIDKQGKLANIITQSDALKFIQANTDLWEGMKSTKVSDLYLSNQYPLAIQRHEKAIEAFRLMSVAKVSGVGILDEDGSLIGNISANDLKKASNEERFFSRLFMNSWDFVQKRGVIAVMMEDTLQTAVETLLSNHIHRLYVINRQQDPVGVLTLTDILAEILERIKA